LKSGSIVRTEIDVTERSGTNFTADAVFVTDTEILPRPVSLCSYDLFVMAQASHIAVVSAKRVYACRHRTQYS